MDRTSNGNFITSIWSKMEKSFGLMFYQKKTKQHVQGMKVPVYVRITVNNEQTDLSTKQKCNLGLWNAEIGRMNGKSEEARELNAFLDLIEQKVYASKRKLMEMDVEVTADRIRCLVQDRPIDQDRHTIMEAFKLHNEQMKQLVGIDFAEGTMERYQTSYDHTLRFLQHRYKVSDLDLTKLDYEFIVEYEFWLKTERKCSHNTTMKYLSNFEKIVHICLAKKWLRADPFLGYKKSKKPVDKIPLSEIELKAIASKQFTTDRLGAVRDIFLFSCFTGLAYADTQKLKKEDVFIGVDGNKWINCKRQKSKSSSRIPLLPVAERLLAKYAEDPFCLETGKLLPVKSNQKMNAYLKEIADVCGINKTLTTHIARHTFATTVTLSNKIPIETVSKMLAHQKISTTQEYAKILDDKVSRDMSELRLKYI